MKYTGAYFHVTLYEFDRLLLKLVHLTSLIFSQQDLQAYHLKQSSVFPTRSGKIQLV